MAAKPLDYRALVEQIPAVFYNAALDQVGSTRYASPQIETMLGFTADEWMADPALWFKQLYPADRERVLAEYARGHASGETFHAEYRLLARDGRVVWIWDEARTVFDDEGQPLVQGIMLDITERKRAQAALRRSPPELADFVETAGVDLHQVGGDRHTPWANQAELDMLEEYIGHQYVGGIAIDITEHKRAKETRARYAAKLQVLAQASLTIHSALSLEEVTRIVTEKAREIIGAHRSVTSLALDGNWAQAITASSSSHKYAAYGKYDVKQDSMGLGRLVRETNRPLRMTQAELEAHPAWRGFGTEADQHPPLRGWLAAPLIGHNNWNIGLIQLSDKYEGEFAADDEAILVQLAQLASIAIENARLFETIRRRVAELTVLHRVAVAATEAASEDAIIERATQIVGDSLYSDSDHFGVLLLDEAAGVLRVHPSYRMRGGQPAFTTLSLGGSLSGHVAREGKPRRVLNVTREPPYVEGDPRTRSEVCVPLRAGEHVLGVINAESFQPHAFGEADERLLMTTAGQLATAIERKRTEQEILRQNEEVRRSREQLRALSRQLLEVQEAERRYVTRELHDEIGQALTGLRLLLQMGVRLPAQDLGARLDEAQALVHDLLNRVHNLSLDLRPTILDDLGLLPALLAHFERYTAQTGVRVTCEHRGLDRRFESVVETAAYRIVQEALTNVARHAGVSEVRVRLWTAFPTLDIQIEDKGAGFDPEAAWSARASSGLAGMRERADLLGGHLGVESAPGLGTQVNAQLPLAAPLERRATNATPA